MDRPAPTRAVLLVEEALAEHLETVIGVERTRHYIMKKLFSDRRAE